MFRVIFFVKRVFKETCLGRTADRRGTIRMSSNVKPSRSILEFWGANPEFEFTKVVSAAMDFSVYCKNWCIGTGEETEWELMGRKN